MMPIETILYMSMPKGPKASKAAGEQYIFADAWQKNPLTMKYCF
jgi:hypothetical protein